MRLPLSRSLYVALAVLCTSSLARSQPAPPAPPPQPPLPGQPGQPAQPKSETEQLVPPQGSAVDVPMHAGTVCILSFPEKLAPKAISSSADFEIQAWGPDGIAVRAVIAKDAKPAPSTLALATATGLIKVNATLRVVADTEPAFTLVRFKAASEAEAFDAQVKAGIAKGMAPLEASLVKQQQALAKKLQELDSLIVQQSDHDTSDRVLRRVDIQKLDAHARNDDHVILHLGRGVFLGEDGFLVFEIQNRSGSPYELAAVRVLSEGRSVGADVRLSTSLGAPPGSPLIGVVAPHTTTRGVISIRTVQRVLQRPLTLEVSAPKGRAAIRLDRIVLR